MKKLKITYWIALTVLYLHIMLKYRITDQSVDTIGKGYFFLILPLGYALYVVLFTKTQKKH